MSRRRLTDLAIGAGISIMLAGAAIAQTTSPAPSASRPGPSTGPTIPPPPAPSSAGSRTGPAIPPVGSGAPEMRPSIGQTTPGTAPGTTIPGTPIPATPGTNSGMSSPLPPAGAGYASTAQVRSAQQALQGKGMDPGPIDGVAGPKTEQAVREFQKAQNLSQTGRLDAQTLQKLGVSAQ